MSCDHQAQFVSTSKMKMALSQKHLFDVSKTEPFGSRGAALRGIDSDGCPQQHSPLESVDETERTITQDGV